MKPGETVLITGRHKFYSFKDLTGDVQYHTNYTGPVRKDTFCHLLFQLQLVAQGNSQ